MFEVEQTKTCNASGLVTYYIFCMMECSFISNQQVCFFSIGIMVMLLCVITLLMLYLFLRSLPSVSFSFFSSLSLGRFCGHFITLFLKKKKTYEIRHHHFCLHQAGTVRRWVVYQNITCVVTTLLGCQDFIY